ncbi:hypothetical protein EXP36_00155 [Salmonella enterica subsp. enterica serovar Weltevreden]|jgi:hypothetical protein|nr:hypothetical protein [Salmonella enterica]ECB4558093.1 hypothetical protein [Salmonella enterica subsp. enterica serovar Weltevreden]ECD7026944.1 hypothetical protein [Salmonella enterica subsp. enterica serovar Heidelberg]ECE8180739.1 hypothetical protein [Salmonella enterica subsp. enterica serovar Enteritidis]EDK7230860.1 hypothetical protein [Salmonella enterica subsp. enterica serovar Java]EEE9654198.1 hypothetical protein [Salmonella enterica subsp. enterica serovar Bareilly]MJU45245
MISSVLTGVRLAYAGRYPGRALEMINRLGYVKEEHGNGEWTRTTMDDTGICFGIAMMVKDVLKNNFNTPCEIVYIYRRYNAEEGDGFEDILVHAVLWYDGKFYDSDDFTGVNKFEDLSYIRGFEGLGARMHYPSYPERGDTGSRDTIPNKITPELHEIIEKTIGFRIPRRNVF